MNTPTPLISCPACDKEVSRNARACPHCGEPAPATDKRAGVAAAKAVLVALLIGGGFWFWSWYSAEREQLRQMDAAAAAAKAEQAEHLRNRQAGK